MLTKHCSCCKETKDVALFSKDSSKKDGLQYVCKECNRQYRKENRDRINKRDYAHKKLNPERMAKNRKKYKSKNLFLYSAHEAKRRASKLQATPNWADLEVIKGMYQLAALFNKTGINLHVDHIVPLQNDNVCGLHCEDNLQLMPSSLNYSKGNRYWPDMW